MAKAKPKAQAKPKEQPAVQKIEDIDFHDALEALGDQWTQACIFRESVERAIDDLEAGEKPAGVVDNLRRALRKLLDATPTK